MVSQPQEGFEEQHDRLGSERAELDEATHEPGARVEQEGDYAEAKAIEGALTELVDTKREGQALPCLGSVDGEAQNDWAMHFRVVEDGRGEVLQDQDWNEEGGTDAWRSLGAEVEDDRQGDPMMCFKPVPAQESQEDALDRESVGVPGSSCTEQVAG
jgi:hypothetical protein